MTVDRTQVMAALDTANRIRSGRADIRRALKAAPTARESRDLLADILEQEPIPACLDTMLLIDLMRCVRGLLQTGAIRVLKALEATSFLTVAQMTDRQRSQLIVILRGDIRTLRAAEDQLAYERWRRQYGRRAA